MNKNNLYKYQSDKDLKNELFLNLSEYLKPFFNSFRRERKTFIIQLINFSLIIAIIYCFLGKIVEKILSIINNGDSVILKLLFIAFGIIFLSALKENKTFRWQTLFSMDYKFSVLWLKRIIVICLVCYTIKYFKYDYD